MGAAESKQEEQVNRNRDDHEERRKKESSMGSRTALAVGAGAALLALAVGPAAGAALLGVAWGVSRYRSSSSGERVDNHDDHEERRKKESSMGSGTALAIGAGAALLALAVGPAAGAVLLGLAWGVSRYRSSSSGERVGNHDDHEERRKKKSSMGSGTALAVGTGAALLAVAVGPAAGAALLGLAWGVSPHRSSSSGERVDNHDLAVADYRSESAPISNSIRNSGSKIFLEPISNSKPVKLQIKLKILTYNVCFREDYEIQERMMAIGDLVQKHYPHFICFQEITPAIYTIFEKLSWWNYYYCSMSKEEASNRQCFCILLSRFCPVNSIKTPLGASKMGKELWVTETKVGTNKSLVVATSHLKSPGPDPSDSNSQDPYYTKERQRQAKEALAILQHYPNVVFCGDMNWNEKTDGEFPLPYGWIDAWTKLRGEEKGYTFDTESNAMLNGRPCLQMRLDRILCNFEGFRLEDIDIIGQEAIPDVTYPWNNKLLPVLPSDHYGLLLTICTYWWEV